MKRILLLLVFILWVFGCEQTPTEAPETQANNKASSEIMADGTGGGAGIQQPDIQWEVPPDVELYIEKGYYGRNSWWRDNLSAYISVQYNQTRDELWLYYYLWRNGSFQYRGWGYIPPSSLSGSYKSGVLHLDVDLSQAPNFNINEGGPVRIIAHFQKTGAWSRVYGHYDFFRDNLSGSSSGHLGNRKGDSAEGWMKIAGFNLTDSNWGEIGSLREYLAWFTMPN